MLGESSGPVCPYACRGCNKACRAYIPDGDRCGVLEWMRITGNHIEILEKIGIARAIDDVDTIKSGSGS